MRTFLISKYMFPGITKVSFLGFKKVNSSNAQLKVKNLFRNDQSSAGLVPEICQEHAPLTPIKHLQIQYGSYVTSQKITREATKPNKVNLFGRIPAVEIK